MNVVLIKTLDACGLLYFYTPSFMLYPLNRWRVRPSVSASFLESNLSSFWPIFFKLCMDIDIKEEWFGIANGLNWFLNNIVMALDRCKNVFFLDIVEIAIDKRLSIANMR